MPLGTRGPLEIKKKNIHIHGQKIEPGQNNGSREG